MILQGILQNFYYIVVAIMAIILLVNILKERETKELICIAVVLVTFVLRALHIK